ncbi:MAG: polyprenyl diphosphate synthase [Pseudomonadota bacterium]
MSAPIPSIPSSSPLPRHVAVIMDGNGRWANQRALPRQAGHRAGVKSARQLVEYLAEQNVECLTLFAFSSENWDRPRDEVGALMTLFIEVLRRESDNLHKNNVRLRFIGDRPSLGPRLGKRIAVAEQRTRDNTGLKLNIAMAYGGRWDIVEAARKVAEKVAAGSLPPEQIDERIFGEALELGDCPEVDLLIRTGGEKRISNFLLWNLAYAELFFSDILWPEFSPANAAEAIRFFQARQRRYGRTGEQIEAQPC